jgi:hypothetical protein
MKYILLILFCIAFLQPTKSNKDFITKSSQWVYTLPDSYGNPLAGYNVYKYIKDTIIQENNCKFIECDNPDLNVIVYENNQNVYYYQDERFKLLYDFSVNKNDTVFLDIRAVSFRIIDEQVIPLDTTLSVESIVTEVDSVQFLDSIYLRRITVEIYPEADFLINSTWPETISYIEKLGYLLDGFIPIIIEGFSTSISNDRSLRCYLEDNLLIITDFWKQFSQDCYYITTVGENAMQDFMIYPNPFKNVLNITNSASVITESFFIEIIDYTGKKVYNSYLTKDYNLQLSLDHLQNGIYFIIFRYENSKPYYSIKLMKL